jgi:hypothetical protein
MTSSYPPKAQYNVAMMETVTLEVTASLHPVHLSKADLTLKIVSDPDDDKEVGTLAQAIRNLREFGLFADRDDELVELTPAVLRAVACLT